MAPPDLVTGVDLGHGVTAHVTRRDTGDDDRPHAWELDAVAHHCHLDDGSKVTMTVEAAAYAESHSIGFSTGGDVTVRPAIACDCCGLYGEITDGVFQPVEADR